MTHYKTSLLRLLVPVAVGMATGLLSTVKAHNPELAAVLSPAASYGYYALVAWFEKSHPAASRLLVSPRPSADANKG
jgi:hypothetical protein